MRVQWRFEPGKRPPRIQPTRRRANRESICALVKALVVAHPFTAPDGPMAEWLRSGLQIRARRFDSGSGLQIFCANYRFRALTC
jgi:hypothetical protein